jgi:D-tyrosyl-tRNA(Tyr) deacylase
LPSGFGTQPEAGFCAALKALDVPVQTGVIGARMRVEIANDGPVTIVLD